MSWFKDKPEPSFFESFCYRVVKAGKVPQHVAFIMDGNRRFARKNQLATSAGHSKGFDKLTQVLSWCFELGIPEVSVYAFSIENFKRSKEEVDCLMALMKEKFERLLEERDHLQKYGVCIRTLGDLSMLPRDVQLSIARVVQLTKENDRHVLNVAIAYTARNEITQAVKEVCFGVQNDDLKISDITTSLIEKCLYTSKCRDVDLLIRTSGEVRLSDFLLWQSSFSALSFLDVLWPELTLKDFLYTIIKFQLGFNKIQSTKELSRWKQEKDQLDQDLQAAHANLIHRLSQQGQGNGYSSINKEMLETELRRCSDERRERVDRFLERLDNRRLSFILELVKSDNLN